jgi:hypothetical protein
MSRIIVKYFVKQSEGPSEPRGDGGSGRLFWGGLTTDSDALIIKVWSLPTVEIVGISGGSIGYKRTFTALKASIHSAATPIIHSNGHLQS